VILFSLFPMRMRSNSVADCGDSGSFRGTEFPASARCLAAPQVLQTTPIQHILSFPDLRRATNGEIFTLTFRAGEKRNEAAGKKADWSITISHPPVGKTG
jgi:hypothetical protein